MYLRTFREEEEPSTRFRDISTTGSSIKRREHRVAVVPVLSKPFTTTTHGTIPRASVRALRIEELQGARPK